MRFLPVFLDLQAGPVLLVGAGELVRAKLRLLAAAGASVAAYFVDTRVLQLHYTFDWWICVEGLVGGALLVAGTGWLATRSVVNQPPLKTLRA